ncbi:hypothetical protein PIB30_104207 [Stylosanthes scabra]|uniref:Uncharacterized protein n=1 Tax=Stylosanthes scabra TaxID=79078 RepID=A0ABU6XX76_9FABA|nr:hypothetical protein [Stylosanthes scabra]
MFASHGRILTNQVMQLYVQILDTQTATPGASPSDSRPAVYAPMMADPVDVIPPPEHTESQSPTTRIQVTLRRAVPDRAIMSLCRLHHHFHTLHLDAMEEEQLTNIGVGGDDYDLDGV